MVLFARVLVGLSVLVNMVLVIVLAVTLFVLSPREQLQREEMTRGLFSRQCLDAARVNQYLSDNGVVMTVVGGVDAIGNPKDNWMQFAREALHSESRRSDAGIGVAMLAAIASFLLVGLALVVHFVSSRMRHRCKYPQSGLPTGAPCPECGKAFADARRT